MIIPNIGVPGRSCTEFAREVKVASGGRIDIEVFGVGEVVPGLEMFEACAKGALDLALSYGAYWVGKVPASAFSQGLPFTTRDIRDGQVLMHDLGVEDIIRKAYAEHNVYLVRVMPMFALSMQTKFPVYKVSDLKGRKIRATGLPADLLTEAGASTVYFPVPEIYSALERGVVEGATVGPLSFQYDMGFHEVTGHLSEPPLTNAEGDEIIMGLDLWNSLPDDLKMILYTCSADLAERTSAGYRYEYEWKKKKMVEEFGCKVITLPLEEQKILAAHMATVMDRYSAEDAYFAEAAKITKDYMKLIGLLD